MKQRTNSSILKSAKPILHNVTQRYTTLHNVTQRYTTLILGLFMLLPTFSFGQLTEAPKATAPFISATPSIYDTYRDDTPNPASRSAICTDPTLVKYVNVNIHFIQENAGLHNFAKNHDGLGNSNYTGYDHAEVLVNNMNAHFDNNQQMQLPCGNNTDNPPIRIQYVLKGVYFHASSNYADDGVGDWSVHTAYGVNVNTEINIYHINNPSQSADGVAKTIGGSTDLAVKIWKDYAVYKSGGSSWGTAKLLNHEVAHNLNLKHAWGSPDNDGCSDTPPNNNCWNINYPSASNTLCDDWCEISNNLMDYNFSQSAVTPCQISRMHNRLNTGANPYVNSCEECMPSNSFFYLPETVCLENQTVTLDGRGSWKETSYMLEIYQVASVGSSVQVGNTYQIYNYTGTVGNINLTNIYTFQSGKVYQVRLITFNSCGGHSSVNWVTTQTSGCYNPPSPPGETEKMANINASTSEAAVNLEYKQDVVTEFQPTDLTITPNPAKDVAQISFSTIAKESYQVTLWNNFGQQLKVIAQGETVANENLIVTLETADLASGNYFVVLQTSKQKTTKQLVIIK